MHIAFKKELDKYGLLNPDKRVVLAISGGVDSMVLLGLFQRIPKSQRPTLFIAHVNHELREESKSEEKFVQAVAESKGIPLFVYHWKQSMHPQTGIEEAARNVRYSFFKEILEQMRADVLMTAHHQDDQAETILMKLTRGSALEQITGIAEAQSFHGSQLIRPLLRFSKDEIYHYAEVENIDYMEDQSNFELIYSRNRFRNLIIPLLKEENVKINDHLQQFVNDLDDLLCIAEGPIKETFKQLVTIHPNQIEFQLPEYLQLNEPMQRAVLVELLNVLYENQDKRYKISYIEILQDWLQKAEGNSQLHFTDEVTVHKTYDNISIRKNNLTSQTLTNTEPRTSFIIQDNNPYVQLSSTESIELKRVDSIDLASNGKHQKNQIDQLVFDSEHVVFPLTIRHRQPGDRMTYKGLKGTKKIKDILIDEKVPAMERDKAWVVEDATGTIVWLISYRKMYLLSEVETDKLTYILNYNKDQN